MNQVTSECLTPCVRGSTRCVLKAGKNRTSPWFVKTSSGSGSIGKTDLTEATAVAGTQGLACRPRFQGKVLRAAA